MNKLFEMEKERIRNSYTVAQKLAVVKEHEATGISLRETARRNNIPASSLADWIANKHIYSKLERDKREILKMRHATQGCQPYLELEDHVFKWIRERNRLGLHADDFMIQQTAADFRDKQLRKLKETDEDYQKYKSFQATRKWLEKFKSQKNLNSQKSGTFIAPYIIRVTPKAVNDVTHDVKFKPPSIQIRVRQNI